MAVEHKYIDLPLPCANAEARLRLFFIGHRDRYGPLKDREVEFTGPIENLTNLNGQDVKTPTGYLKVVVSYYEHVALQSDIRVTTDRVQGADRLYVSATHQGVLDQAIRSVFWTIRSALPMHDTLSSMEHGLDFYWERNILTQLRETLAKHKVKGHGKALTAIAKDIEKLRKKSEQAMKDLKAKVEAKAQKLLAQNSKK